MIQLETFNQDTLKTLNLYDNINGYNNAAGLLADKIIFRELILLNLEKVSVSFREE